MSDRPNTMRIARATPLSHLAGPVMVIIALCSAWTPAAGQCTNTAMDGSAVAPTSPIGLTIGNCTYQSEYNTITGVVAGSTYTAYSSCGGHITVRQGTFNGTVIASGNAPLDFTATVSGTYFIHYNTNAACGTLAYCCTTSIACSSCSITPPPGACTAVNIPSLPVSGQSLVCHASNLLTGTNINICGGSGPLYLGGTEALYTVTPAASGYFTIEYTGQTYGSIWVFSGICPAAGGTCEGSVNSSSTSTSLGLDMVAGVQYWIIFDTWPGAAGPCPGTFSITPTNPPVVASDCPVAVNVCTDIGFLIDPNGYGEVNEVPSLGSISNPDYISPNFNPWGTMNRGCLRIGERNSTWMIVNVLTGGDLTFTFGGLNTQTGYYDWAMYPMNGDVCSMVATDMVAPVRCNWNGVPFGGTGLASALPPGGNGTNYEPPLAVGSLTRWLICFSNWSSVSTAVPLQFGGTAVVSCVPLPVELIRFDVAVVGTTVALDWVTGSERNSARYGVERSPDGVAWTGITVLAAAGNSEQALRYSTVDRTPLQGTSYYRLRMIDRDGGFEFSPVQSITRQQAERTIFPNPAQGHFVVNGITVGADVRLIDALGRSVPITVSRVSDSAVHVEALKAHPGLYTVQITSNGIGSSERVLIAH